MILRKNQPKRLHMHYHHSRKDLRNARRSAILERTGYYVYKKKLDEKDYQKGYKPGPAWEIYATVT